jgi:tetratricopeptide (TPR) repeat protein
MGLKMKCLAKSCVIFIASFSFLTFAQGQAPTTSAPATSGDSTIAPAPAPPPPDVPNFSTQPTPGAATAATPSPTGPVAKPSVTWSTAALQTELAHSVAEMDKKNEKIELPKTKLSSSKVDSLRAKLAKNEKDEKSRIKLAEFFLATSKLDEAIELLRPQMGKLSRNGLLLLAKTYRVKKDYVQEARTLDVIATKNPTDYVVQHLLGEAYAHLKKSDDAYKYFTEARRLNPHYLPAYESILLDAKRSSRVSDAIAIAQEMQAQFGDKPFVLNELCLLYAHEAFLEKAVETCRQGIELSPKYPRNHVVLGLVMKDQDGNASAAKILDKAAKQFKNSEFAQYAAGELAWERKNTVVALEFFKQAAADEPKSSRSQLGLGRSAFEEQDYKTALEAFTAACKLDRAMLSDFRRSASVLRKKNDLTWTGRYDAGLSQCGFR